MSFLVVNQQLRGISSQRSIDAAFSSRSISLRFGFSGSLITPDGTLMSGVHLELKQYSISMSGSLWFDQLWRIHSRDSWHVTPQLMMILKDEPWGQATLSHVLWWAASLTSEKFIFHKIHPTIQWDGKLISHFSWPKGRLLIISCD